MLQHEEHIKKDANLAQAKLDRVARDAAPVVLEVAVDALLADAQESAPEVQQDGPDAPALGALVAEVGEQLRRVLDERDDELDVANGVDNVEVAPVHGRVDLATRCGGGADNDVGDSDA